MQKSRGSKSYWTESRGYPYPVPVMKNEEDEGTEEIKPFEGNSELYYVNESILEVNESGKSVSDPSLPIKEHNQIVRMSGYLTTTSNSRSRVSCR